MKGEQGTRKKRDVRWYLDDDDGGSELPEPEFLPFRYRRWIRIVIRTYWLSLMNACGLILLGANGGVFNRRDSEAVAIIAMGVVFLASITVLVVGYSLNSKQIAYRIWEQVGFFLAHFTCLALGVIGGVSLLA